MRYLALAGLLSLAACAPVAGTVTTSTAATTTSTTSDVTTTVATTEGPARCVEDLEFLESGQVARIDQPTSDASILGLISWDGNGGCERFHLEFDTNEGAPATTPPSVTVEFLDSGQILRINLDLERTVLTDQLVETTLVDRLYVVRALGGGLFVDLHLATPSQARATVRNSPAGLTVELQMGIMPFAGAATTSDQAVVLEPAPGSETDTTVEVRGYTRTFEATVLVIATSGGKAVAEATTQAADWVETWGEFRTSIEVPPGPTSLFVGEESPEDGALAGAIVEITAR
ncbi:MAG TPA: Gmad2 immunoglobulin-like domain-containing protein [Acidimicrobiia bacterium]|nr:Gmad2 immunoglobulin-like domain-containing protein [Acidimicrobiia bacterium]